MPVDGFCEMKGLLNNVLSVGWALLITPLEISIERHSGIFVSGFGYTVFAFLSLLFVAANLV